MPRKGKGPLEPEERVIFKAASLFFVSALTLLFFRDPFGLEIRAGLFVRDILSGKGLLIPHAYERPYFDYPPLFFLLEAFFSKILAGPNALSLALPSLISGTLLILFVFFYVKRLIGEKEAFFSGLILFATPEFWLKSEKATLDVTLSLFVFLAVINLYLSFLKYPEDKKTLFIALIFSGLSYFTKGLIGLFLAFAPLFLFFLVTSRIKSLIRFLFIALFFSFLLISFHIFLLYLNGNISLLMEILNAQVFSRLGTKPNRPFFYYFFYILLICLPWILWILFWGFKEKIEISNILDKRFLKNDAYLFFLCWFLSDLFPFLIASSRHSRYLLPIFSALAILISFFLVSLLCIINDKARYYNQFKSFCFLIFFVCFLSSLFIEPPLSKRESGRHFVEETERSLKGNEKIIIYKMERDGNGLKYALFSKFYPKGLIFLKDSSSLKEISPPFVIVLRENRFNEIKGALSSQKNGAHFSLTIIASGLIHSKKVEAILIRQKNDFRPNSSLLKFFKRKSLS